MKLKLPIMVDLSEEKRRGDSLKLFPSNNKTSNDKHAEISANE